MRVRVSYPVDVTDEYRRAIRRYYGKTGMATRKEVAGWFKWYGMTMEDDLMNECSDEAAAKGKQLSDD